MKVKIIFITGDGTQGRKEEEIELRDNRVREILRHYGFLEDEVLLVDGHTGRILTPYDFLTSGAEIEVRRVYSTG